MPIDFKCNSCSHLIRVPDGTEGKKTMCPKCSVAQQIPGGSAPGKPETPGIGGNDFSDQANFGSSAGASDFAPDPTNPYASPETGYQPQAGPSVPGQINPQKADIGLIVNHSMECWKENLGILIGAFVTVIVSAIVFYVILQIIQAALMVVSPELAIGVGILGSLASNAFQVYLGIGVARIALGIARKENVEFSELFTGGDRFLPIWGLSFGANILMMAALFGAGFIAYQTSGEETAFIVVIGLAVLIGILSLLFMIFFWPFYYLYLDKKSDLFESFSIAYQITTVNLGNTFLLGLLSAGIVLLGYIACCLGLIFAVPLVSMLWATAYLQMTGQIQAR